MEAMIPGSIVSTGSSVDHIPVVFAHSEFILVLIRRID